jgi:hypothetical protein
MSEASPYPWLEQTMKALLASMKEQQRVTRILADVLGDLRDTHRLLLAELQHIRTAKDREARLVEFEMANTEIGDR